MRLRRYSALGLVLLVSSSAVVSLAGSAAAHAAYKESSPADEATVSQAPAEIWAEYTEPLQEGSWMKVFDPCGAQVDHDDVRVEGYRMYLSMSGEARGTYEVQWMAASAIDPHTTRGTFTFTATEGAACPGEEPEAERGSEPKAASGGSRGNGESRTAEGDRGESATGETNGGDARSDMRADARSPRDRSGSQGARSSDDVAAPPNGVPESSVDEPEEPGLFSDIPIGGLALGLAIAAAIGAVGGLVYAGIMGYTRPTA